MTRQELLDKGFTEEQATLYLNDFHALNNRNKELESKIAGFDEKSKEFDELKKQMDEINKSKMTEQEKLKLLLKEAEEKNTLASRNYNKSEIKTILAGIELDDEFLESLVSDNKDKSIANANAFLKTINATKEAVEKATKEAIANANIKPNPNNTNPNGEATIKTREEFMNLSHEDKLKFKEENKEVYDKIMNK